jgi:ankyrin repeat protein
VLCFPENARAAREAEIAAQETKLAARRAGCRKALYLTDPAIDRNNIIRAKGDRAQGTCEWIKNNTRFQSWLRGDRRLLWIQGGPGKGKTMMSVYLTEYLEGHFAEEVALEEPKIASKTPETALKRSRSLAYYFCVGQEMERNNASAVLRGLLWQITGRHEDLLEHLVLYLDTPERGKAALSSEETLWFLLRELCRHATKRRLYCLVDGVDECDEDSMHWLVDKFVTLGRGTDFPNLCIIALSRPVTGLPRFNCITLDPDHDSQVSADVRIFVQSKVRVLSQNLCLDAGFETNVKNVLLAKSEGTFLWVGFVMGELLKKRTRSKVEEALENLPKGLPAFYGRMLQSIEPGDRSDSKELLTCVLAAFEPLPLEAFADILGCRSSANISAIQAVLDKIDNCAPMLQCRDITVDFVHQSAKDYLLRVQPDDDPILEGFRIRPEMAHFILARHCIRSLSRKTELRRYSFRNLLKHVKQLSNMTPRLLQTEPAFFGKHSNARDTWWNQYRSTLGKIPSVIPPRLHIACSTGLEAWAQAILLENERSGISTEAAIHEKCPAGWVVLDYAAVPLFKILLNTSPSSKYSARQLEHALDRAVTAQHKGAVRQLLNRGAKGSPFLLHATRFRNKAIAQLLLEQGADPNFQSHDGHTVLHSTINRGDLRSMKLLLAHGADPNISRSTSDLVRSGVVLHDVRDSALHAEATSGRHRIVQLLVDHGIDTNMRSAAGETAMHAVSSNHRYGYTKKLQLVRSLLAGGADIDARRRDGQTALHVAAGQRQNGVDTVRALCDSGADANIQDCLGETALHGAVRPHVNPLECSQIVQTLLRAGAAPNAQGHGGQTPLHVATEMESFASARVLLDHGAKVDVEDGDGDTALHIAVRCGFLDIENLTKLLFDGEDGDGQGCDADIVIPNTVSRKDIIAA